MKRSLFEISAFVFLTCLFCKDKIDVAKGEEAVLKVLQEEGDAFAKNDLNRLSAIYIQDSTETRVSLGATYCNLYKGWDKIEELYENYIKVNSTDSSWKNPRNYKENIIMKVAENSAWLLCDNIWEFEFKNDAGNNVAGKQANMQIAFFEKINGKWKISFNAFIQKPVPKAKVTE